MRGEAAFELAVVLLVQVVVVDIEIGGALFYAFREIGEEVPEVGPEDVGAAGVCFPAPQLPDHPVELAIADGGPEGVFGPGMEAAVEEVEVVAEMVCEDEEPHLVAV